MVIELFGCPGSGKTFVLEMIHDMEGYKNTSQTSQIRSYINKILKKLLLFSPCAIQIRRCILFQIKGNRYTGTFNSISIRTMINNISMLASVYRYMNKKLYIDEGLIHRIITMCINYEIPKEKAKQIIEAIHDNLKEVKPYFMDTPVNICYESIIIRNRHEASIDSLRGESLMALLQSYYEYCSYIADEFGYERIKRENAKEVLP